MAWALGGRPADQVVPSLLIALEDPVGRVRETAASALGRTEQTLALTRRFIGLLRQGSAPDRVIAVRAPPVAGDRTMGEMVMENQAEQRDKIDQALLSRDLDGFRSFRDPRWPVPMGQVRLSAWRLALPIDGIRLRYEALAEEFGLPVTWRS